MSPSNDKPILRDPKTGQLLPGSRGIGGGKKAFRNVLRRMLGEHGEKAYDGILAIAEGRTTYEKLAREPAPHEDAASAALIPSVRVVPSIRERLDAWIFLAEQLNGKATVDVDAHVQHEHSIRDYARLDDAQLAQLESMLSLAELPERRDAIEGEFKVEVAALPAGGSK